MEMDEILTRVFLYVSVILCFSVVCTDLGASADECTESPLCDTVANPSPPRSAEWGSSEGSFVWKLWFKRSVTARSPLPRSARTLCRRAEIMPRDWSALKPPWERGRGAALGWPWFLPASIRTLLCPSFTHNREFLFWAEMLDCPRWSVLCFSLKTGNQFFLLWTCIRCKWCVWTRTSSAEGSAALLEG